MRFSSDDQNKSFLSKVLKNVKEEQKKKEMLSEIIENGKQERKKSFMKESYKGRGSAWQTITFKGGKQILDKDDNIEVKNESDELTFIPRTSTEASTDELSQNA